jgi:hypothetical protein
MGHTNLLEQTGGRQTQFSGQISFQDGKPLARANRRGPDTVLGSDPGKTIWHSNFLQQTGGIQTQFRVQILGKKTGQTNFPQQTGGVQT